MAGDNLDFIRGLDQDSYLKQFKADAPVLKRWAEAAKLMQDAVQGLVTCIAIAEYRGQAAQKLLEENAALQAENSSLHLQLRKRDCYLGVHYEEP